VKILNKFELIEINKRMIERFGGYHNGKDNILNRNSLNYLIKSIDDYKISGNFDLYYIASKYAISIIKNHIFYDGNKRTGIEASILFLKINKIFLSDKVSDEILVSLALDIESGKSDYDETINWFVENTY